MAPVVHQETGPAKERRKRIQFSKPKNTSVTIANYLFGCILPRGLIMVSRQPGEEGNVLQMIWHGEDEPGADEHAQVHRKDQTGNA